jgi:hemolysin activation/secretion protein
MKSPRFVACCVALQAMLAMAPAARAQTPPPAFPANIGDAVRAGEQTRQAAPPSGTPATLVLPRLAEPQFTLKDKETLYVRSFKVESPKLVDEAQVHDLLLPYEKRKLTLAQIYEAADKITTLYRTHGYLLAKAYVPAQDARGGVLRIKVLPGKYGAVTVTNKSLVRDSFLQAVVDHALDRSPYIRQEDVERAMLEINALPGAGMPRAVIGAGAQPETTDFTFAVPEGRRVDGYVLGDNYGPPFEGRYRVSSGLDLNSPLGIGDQLSVFGIMSDNHELENGRAAYSAPLGYDGLRGEVAAYRTTYVLGGAFAGLDATGMADGFTGTLTYPVLLGRSDSIFISGKYAHEELNDNIFGISIDRRFIDSGTASITRNTAGAVFGLPVSTSAVLAIVGGYVRFPDPTQAALNIAGPDSLGDYAKLALSATATVALAAKWSLSVYFRGQKSLTRSLDSSEQIGLTGYYGVRSFDEGLSGDSGYIVTPTLKYALPDVANYHQSVGVFTDVGGVWLENPFFTIIQKPFTQLNDAGAGYYATYEYSPGRSVLFKAEVAHTYGATSGAQFYNEETKGLVQVGMTF